MAALKVIFACPKMPDIDSISYAVTLVKTGSVIHQASILMDIMRREWRGVLYDPFKRSI